MLKQELSRPFRGAVVSLAAVLIASTGGAALAAGVEDSEASAKQAEESRSLKEGQTRYRTIKVDGLEIFYREAGPVGAPTLLLLHGFPTSSQMFRELIPRLADTYRVIAPDYPGYGQSAQPSRETFAYTFDNLAKIVDGFTEQLKLDRFTIYVQDYGAPIGYRIASAHPERIAGIIVQNGNAYDEGLDNEFWKPIKKYWAEPTAENREALRGFLTIDGTKWQYLHGARNPEHISPDAWTLDQAGLDRPGNKEIQLDLFLSYGTNPPLYPKWQQYFRDHQPPTLIVWGENDQIFPPAGAEPYKRDLKNLDYNILDTGHFALEEEGAVIATKIREFMERRVVRATK